MIKKFLITISLWDWKSIRNAIIMIVILGILFWRIGFGATNDYEKKLKELDSVTNGVITHIKALDYTSQGFDGSTDIPIGYKVTYKYEVNGTGYSNTILIKSNQKQYRIITKEDYYDKEKQIKVKYLNYNPHKSLIDF